MSNNLVITQKQIESRIFTIRGIQVMLDSDLADVYQVETRVINQAVKRNSERFPDDFMFQVTHIEWENLIKEQGTASIRGHRVTADEENLISQSVTSSLHGGRRKRPYAFTEQGVAGLSSVLKSETAVKVHVAIMRAFVSLRRLTQENQLVFSRLDNIERKQLETDHKFEQIFKALENKDVIPRQGVFFNGQVFDAYELSSKIIRSAKKSIVLIDNYIDENTFTHLAKKKKGVYVLILTKSIDRQRMLDLQKANEQYGNFVLKAFTLSHDRFIIIDSNEVFHLGASLKDLGKKWFAFSKLEKHSVENIMKEINTISNL
jgi:hypothetical protein